MNFTKKEILELRRMYKGAVADGLEQFQWRGSIILTKYAKYMLEHLDNQSNGKKDEE